MSEPKNEDDGKTAGEVLPASASPARSGDATGMSSSWQDVDVPQSFHLSVTDRCTLPFLTVGAPCGEVTVRDPETVGSTMTKHTTYLIRGHLEDKPPFSVRRRYSDFEWFRKALTAQFPGIRVPPLPKKRVSGRFEESFVEARRAGLEEFLHRCLRIPQLSKECPIFQRFLESAGEGDGISLEELRRSFDGRSIAEMCGTFQTAFADQLARLESPPDDSKLSDAKSFLEAHVVKLRDLTVALRDACDAQKHATALASTAQARFASVSSSDTADAARKPRSIIAAALKQQDEVFQEAPGFHYDLLLAAAERELDETEAMQDALLGLGALHQRLVDAQQKRVFVEVEQKRLSSRTDSGEPSALGKLFGKRDKTTKLEDLASQHAQSLEDAKYAEEWYASARVIAISRELDAFGAEQVALNNWLQLEIARRFRATSLIWIEKDDTNTRFVRHEELVKRLGQQPTATADGTQLHPASRWRLRFRCLASMA
ncbi:vps5 [Symbiodinium microadriaticum]|nr:vps5 [Symbiodinium microadriaticum]